MANNLSTISFVDFEEPHESLCELLYMSMVDGIATQSVLHEDDDDGLLATLEDVHFYVDAFLVAIADLFPHALSISYIITHDGNQYVFSPGNIFTCKVSSKMEEMQVDDLFRFNTTY